MELFTVLTPIKIKQLAKSSFQKFLNPTLVKDLSFMVIQGMIPFTLITINYLESSLFINLKTKIAARLEVTKQFNISLNQTSLIGDWKLNKKITVVRLVPQLKSISLLSP